MTNSDITHLIAQRLQLIRKIRGFSCLQLAQQIGVSAKQVQNYERGRCNMPACRLGQIAAVLHVKADEFLPASGGNSALFASSDKLSHFSLLDLQLIAALRAIRDAEIKRRLHSLLLTLAEEHKDKRKDKDKKPKSPSSASS
ncbi:MAG: helix-turn-helix transcriptional regulator, partial [Alphaproteobacteria bacterium]|nr:helix-turn-helix transcriptional regulator [Alphaproteobacteria bacterium]